MELVIAAEIDDEPEERELTALRDWLQAESPRPGHIELRTPRVEPGTMGAAVDVLSVALGAGGAASVLAGSVSTWLGTRRPRVRLRLRRPDGAELEVDAQTRDADAMIKRFIEEATADS